ncbi:hypothetical protein PPERSA_11671 [Pseudocohnilembus persalinus]|uniref:Uncharacterized protein n=1 Tax=Pseudocohnilembus persalinus TaxID=266149 RepID=A0A0V0QA27_PSEPJ|nr:hypothetical protein PPERSA_11671 [Pseudocohnilembus persalinus]|eukprot:KRW99070.1 hypothetical protein PPERSA_11671 [Pseudocohnilembus persalinus]
MGGDHQQVDEHELKAALIHKLKPLYEPNEGPVIKQFFTYINQKLFDHHHAHINTENYTHKDASSFSKSEQVGRTVAALKKIKEFNHHYFPDNELRILNPANTGIASEVLRIGFAGIDALILTSMWRNWSFNSRSVTFLGALIVGQYFAMHVPNLCNELVQLPRRRQLAKKYIDVYGYNYFHEILNPQYDLHKLHNLSNDLYQY